MSLFVCFMFAHERWTFTNSLLPWSSVSEEVRTQTTPKSYSYFATRLRCHSHAVSTMVRKSGNFGTQPSSF